MPTRFIDVGDLEIFPRITLSSDIPKTERYLTLSHCWGTAPIFRLLNNNAEALTVQLPLDKLPQTFQDAISFTRCLGFATCG